MCRLSYYPAGIDIDIQGTFYFQARTDSAIQCTNGVQQSAKILNKHIPLLAALAFPGTAGFFPGNQRRGVPFRLIAAGIPNSVGRIYQIESGLAAAAAAVKYSGDEYFTRPVIRKSDKRASRIVTLVKRAARTPVRRSSKNSPRGFRNFLPCSPRKVCKTFLRLRQSLLFRNLRHSFLCIWHLGCCNTRVHTRVRVPSWPAPVSCPAARACFSVADGGQPGMVIYLHIDYPRK